MLVVCDDWFARRKFECNVRKLFGSANLTLKYDGNFQATEYRGNSVAPCWSFNFAPSTLVRTLAIWLLAALLDLGAAYKKVKLVGVISLYFNVVASNIE